VQSHFLLLLIMIVGPDLAAAAMNANLFTRNFNSELTMQQTFFD
jgi:hypothetical protein